MVSSFTDRKRNEGQMMMKEKKPNGIKDFTQMHVTVSVHITALYRVT